MLLGGGSVKSTLLRRYIPYDFKQKLLSKVPVIGKQYRTFEILVHPYDQLHGTDTSGYVTPDRLYSDPKVASQSQAYLGTQPSIVRKVLAQLPDAHRYAFVDIGCGKGRPLLIASEFAFKEIVGVEMSPILAQYAARNAGIIKRKFPDRADIKIATENAASYKPTANRIVFFYYHAFGREVFEAFVKNLEDQLSQTVEHAFFIYLNPVFADVVDASPRFSRWSADKMPYEPIEIGFGPDRHDCVVVWQSRPAQYPARERAERVVTVVRRTRAELED